LSVPTRLRSRFRFEHDEAKTMTTILAVDDNAENLELLCQVLEDDFDVITASSGVEGLERAKDDPPAVILLDVQMPEMDGYEVFQKLQEHEATCTIPVIFVTARYRDPDRVARGLELGAFDYITKPIDDDVLLTKVAMAARIRQAEQETRRAQEELLEQQRQRTANAEAANRFLVIANRHTDISSLLGESVEELRALTGCAAAGIRFLDSEGNIPFQAYEGFSREFYELESPLSIKSDQCMCINVIKQNVDSTLPWFTEGGSFYTNSTTRLLATMSEEVKGKIRNMCNQFGYQSVALVPIGRDDCELGLIHVADPRENKVPLPLVELLEAVARQLTPGILRVRAEEELRVLNQELESKVHERTATLNAMVEELRHEIAERQTAEASLRESQRFIQRISDATTYYLWVFDLTEGRVVYANHAFAEFLGVPLDQVGSLSGRAIARTIHPDEVQLHAAHRERVRRALDDEYLDREFRARDHSGQWCWISARDIVLNRSADGSPRQLICTAVDVTKQREAERQLREQAVEFAHFARVGTVGELASGLAHELNQPLLTISLQSELCTHMLQQAEQGSEFGELRDSLQAITEQAQRAGRIVKFVRTFVGDRSLHRSTHELNDVIDRVCATLRVMEPFRSVQIRRKSASDLPRVVIDRTQIEQVIINLLQNASEAMAENAPNDRHVVIESSLFSNEVIQVSVRDNGKGIAESDLDRVFESFFTTKQGGMGLGLAICSTVIDSHGGRLWATANPERGATFYFTLPLGRDQENTPVTAGHP